MRIRGFGRKPVILSHQHGHEVLNSSGFPAHKPMNLRIEWCICSEATGETLALYDALENLPGEARLTASFFELEECLRPIGVLRVDTVPVVPLPRIAPWLIFPAPRSTRKPGPKRQRVEGLAVAGEPDVDGDFVPMDGDDGNEDENSDVTVQLEHDEDFDLEEGLAGVIDNAGLLLEGHMPPPHEEEQQQAAPADGSPAPEQVAPPPPPPEPVALAGRRAGRRGVGDAMVVFPHGKISFYGSKQVMEATCRVPEHGTCVLTRTVRARAGTEDDPAPKAGRPLGFLGAWLLKASHVSTKQEHFATADCHLRDRVTARDYIKGCPNGHELLALERPQKPTEPEEPDSLAGLL